MSSSRYDVVFRGRIREDMTLDQVRQNLAAILKNDSVKVERFFSKQPLVVKKGADSKTALGLMEMFKHAGVECEMIPAAASSSAVSESSTTTGTGASGAGAEARETITCPNCGAPRQCPLECTRCGIVFTKFQGHPTGNAGNAADGGWPRLSMEQDDGSDGKRVWYLLLLLLVVLFGACLFWASGDLRYPPGILVPSEPRQIIIAQPTPWKKGSKVFVPMAEFSLRARVLSKERYRFDAGADICPVDLVLGWGPMSDQGILDSLTISQHYRRFVLAPLSPGPPLPILVLMEHCANMHMIPANEEIEDRLKSLRAGEVIDLDGFLVGIQENGQWTWVSSLTRKDTGDGSCEVIWVRHLQVVPQVAPSAKVTTWSSRSLVVHTKSSPNRG